MGSTPTQTVEYDQAFSPFGEVEAGGNTTDRQWAGINDGVSADLYDAQAREFEDVAARWSAPDPAGVGAFDPADPQSLNRYAYTEGQPLLNIDPSGEFGEGAAFGPWGIAADAAITFGPELVHWLFGGHSGPAINIARAPATATVRDYDGVNWNGALQGEVDGMPVGMSVPQATPFDFGGAGGGVANGFIGPGAVLAGVGTAGCEIAEPCGGIEDVITAGFLITAAIEHGIQAHQDDALGRMPIPAESSAKVSGFLGGRPSASRRGSPRLLARSCCTGFSEGARLRRSTPPARPRPRRRWLSGTTAL